jgi:hypothetical protein
MAHVVHLLVLLVICASGVRMAHAAERLGDALVMYALQDRAQIVDAVERDLLALIESSPDEHRFDLYRAYDQLTGTWVQVELSQSLVEQAAAATSPAEEEKIRTTLRDQAQFALWELDQALAYLELGTSGASQPEYLRINLGIRSLLSETKTIIGRLLADQCDYLQCQTVP